VSYPCATSSSPPDHERCRRRYRELAASYDADTAAGAPYRRRSVDRLGLRRGDTVLDVGCGTGLNFALIEQPIGPEGRLVGVDLCPEMLARARACSERHGWANVTLVEAPAEAMDAGVRADAALLCGTHDILRSPAALANVVRHVRPGGRVVAAGPKWAPWWHPAAAWINAWTWTLNRDYVTTFEGFLRPWSHLERLLGELEVEEAFFGGGYVATGTVPEA
jgi:demethylmenaquinone methyltransferase/2-methoxy-6-polyprenyl-1,4-benzoquinol methylase